MILCTATDRNQTLKRYVEFTSATALSWLRTEEPEGNSADTEPSAPLVGQTIKYSVIKPGSEIPVQNYTLPEPNYYEPLLKYSAIGVANAGYGRPSGHYDSIGISTYESPLHGHYSGNLPVAYTVGSTIPESADLICTNGLHCTVVENKSFLIGMGAAGHAQGLVMGSFVTLGPKNFDSTVCQIYVLSSECSALMVPRKVQRRQHLKMAHQMAMAGLNVAEEARARAVEEEAKLGIDWDDWEDGPHS